MAYCSNCGSEISAGIPVCPNCGRPQGGAAMATRTDGQAIASLVLGIAGLVVCPLVLSIVAIVLGNRSRERIRQDPTLEGEGFAKAGIILGWVGVGLAALGILVAILAMISGALFAGLPIVPR